MDMENLQFKRADIVNAEQILEIIHRCLREVNYVDYTESGLNEALNYFDRIWLKNVIETRHYYEVWFENTIIACGGVSKDLTQVNQCYFSAIFVKPDYRGKGIGKELVHNLEKDNWCIESRLIEIPAAKSSHEFYKNLGYKYREYPPLFHEEGGTTIMYKLRAFV